MEARIESVRENPLLDRFEVEVTLEHEGESTPSEEDVVSRIAAENNLDEGNIEVNGIYTGFGSQTSRAELKIREEFDYDENLEEEAEDREEVGGVEETSEPETEDEEETEDEDASEADYEELVDNTISDAKDALEELEEPDYQAALEAEKDNKNRTTFTDWLENQTE